MSGVLSKFSAEAKFIIYLLVLACAGLVLILLTTSRYGAGVSSDAARNLSTADSLLAGKGFVDMTGAPFILWPPLYPLILASLSLLTRWSTFQAAWFLNVFLYVLNIGLSGWWLYSIFREEAVYAVIGALIVLLSRSTLRIYANVASEPLFATFMLVFFLAAARYLREAGRRALWIMFIMAGLATLQRYLGLALIGVGALVVLSKEGRHGLWRVLTLALVSILPISAWAVFHNEPVSGTLLGPRDLGAMLPLENISLSLTKILWWFIPRLSFLDPLLLQPGILVLSLVVLLIAINRKADWLHWIRACESIAVWPAIVFSVVYFFLLAFTVVTADHLDLTSDRYYVVILPVVLAVLFVTLDQLIITHVHLNRRAVTNGVMALALLWFAYPLYSLQAYIRQALVQGEPTNYNIANSAQFREMSVVKAAEPILEHDPSALIYSNYVNIVWFIFRHPVETLPFEDASLPREQRISALKQSYPNWPRESGYIIWFTPNQYHHIAAPDELATVANLRLIYQDKTGQIYYVNTR
jgi:hypothetical protein